MKVQKRDGSFVKFDEDKIYIALYAANEEVYNVNPAYAITEEQLWDVVHRVCVILNDEDTTVETIQDLVEAVLISRNYFYIARAYIRFRYKKELARDKYNVLMSGVEEKLRAKNVQNQNANVDEHSFGGRMGEVNRLVMKQFALENCMPAWMKEKHNNNEIYIHDLDSYAAGMHNCLSIPYDDLLKNGFTTRQTDVRPANSVNTAFQLVAVIFQLQSLQQFGGVSATHLDWTMVPYVRKSFYKHYKDALKYVEDPLYDFSPSADTPIDDYPCSKARTYAMDMTVKEVYQAVEGLYHNLNTLQSRSGNQLPFTSINYGTCTLSEGRLVIQALLDVSIRGVGKLHKTAIFPCGIFQHMKGVNDVEGTPNYDLYRLALYSTSKRLYPNYANVDWSGNSGYDRNDPRTYFSTMGCRTANGTDVNAEPGQNPQLKDGRGNICPVTIIMPTLAMEVKEKYNDEEVIEKFIEVLDENIHMAKEMLIERFEYICSQPPASADFMYQNHTMFGYHPEQGIRSALKHGTLAIGQLGLAETLQILIGADHTTEKGMALAKLIEQLFKDRCAEFKREEKLNFGVYYTPAENLCYTAMKKFKDKYGVIEKVSDKDYFTNSIHVPVYDEVSVFEKIDIESELTGYSSAGCITYVELDGSVMKNIDALEQIVNYAMDKDVPYFAINVPNDTCLECGYTGEFNNCCPVCGSENIQQLRRVTGYLTGNYKTAFNKGKQAETEDRVKHVGVMK